MNGTVKDAKSITLWVTGKDLIAHISLEGDIVVHDGSQTVQRPIAEVVTNISVPIPLSSLLGYEPNLETRLSMNFSLDITEWLNTLDLT